MRLDSGLSLAVSLESVAHHYRRNQNPVIVVVVVVIVVVIFYSVTFIRIINKS